MFFKKVNTFMMLREFFSYDKETGKAEESPLYSPSSDRSVLKKSDTRKTRLTLGQINKLRKQTDEHNKELEKERTFISRMYATPPQMGM